MICPYKGVSQELFDTLTPYQIKHLEEINLRNVNIKQKYGLTIKDVKTMLEKQEKLCDICGIELEYENMNIDHEHKTKKIRGILCKQCNIGLGFMKDNINSLKNAIKYLEKQK